jgi:hypothetical protein
MKARKTGEQESVVASGGQKMKQQIEQTSANTKYSCTQKMKKTAGAQIH